MRTATLRLPVVLAAALALSLGCGGDDGTGTDDGGAITQAETDLLATEVINAALEALANGQAGTPPSPPRAIGGSQAAVLIYVDYFNRVTCEHGGRMEVSGNLSGSIDNETGSGQAWLQVLITFTDCGMGNANNPVVINGNPYLSMTGTFSFLNGAPATQQTLRLGGALSLPGFCAFNVTMLYATAATATTSISGTICGRDVGGTF